VTKDDLDKSLKGKANETEVRKNFELRDQKIKSIEDSLKDQNKYLNDKIDEQFAIITATQETVSNIYDILSRKK
jgi:hypothetical protein